LKCYFDCIYILETGAEVTAELEPTEKNTQVQTKAYASVALVLECGWIKGVCWLFLQLLPLFLPINT
tara:strand:- start:4618 stop:4818 length:201 start_codon:yes stop_codon:yes gene_type:complete